MSRAFYTPPINVSAYNAEQSIEESYKGDTPSRTSTPNIINKNNRETVKLTETEINEIRNTVDKLPSELLRNIENFIQDLKQPKYSRPLTTNQLSSLFQAFYIKFDKLAFQYLSNLNNTNNGNPVTFFPSRESLSTGLGGIFAFNRSRSGSINSNNNYNNSNNNSNNIRTRNRRSSSLFSNGSNASNNLPLLSPEEIARQLKTNAINNVKINRYMEICEKMTFKILINVGTSVSNEQPAESTPVKNFDIATLFKNTVEFIEFAKLLDQKIDCLNNCSKDNENNSKLIKFLDIPQDLCMTNNKSSEDIEILFDNLISEAISPYEKIQVLIRIHEVLKCHKASSNDDFLPMVIFYIIKIKPKNLFLNISFIKLFRYKKKLVENESFVLTNFEAALVFIETLTNSDIPEGLKEHFTEDNEKLFANTITDVIKLPVSTNKDIQMIDSYTSNSANNFYNNRTMENNESNPNLAASYDGIKSVFDSSIKTIFTKIKPQPAFSNLESDTLKERTLNRSESQISMNFDKTLTKIPSTNNISIASLPSTLNVNNNIGNMPCQWKKYKGKSFDGLTIAELKEIFDIYQKLID